VQKKERKMTSQNVLDFILGLKCETWNNVCIFNV